MPIPKDLKALTELFGRLGAKEPESWARSQLDEGAPQLQRFLFLKQAWSLIEAGDDTGWIGQAIQAAEMSPDAPYSDVGAALKRCIAAGADPSDLAEISRGQKASLLFSLCYLLSDSDYNKPPEESVRDIAWALFQIDNDFHPIGVIEALHESVLETDPTGREMRPTISELD